MNKAVEPRQPSGEIPEGWEIRELSEFCNILMGQSPPSSTYNLKKEGFPFFQGRKDFAEDSDRRDEKPLSPMTKGAKKTKISQAFKTPGEKMLFLFDYGQGWRFTVELQEIKPAETRDLKPKILESIGASPEQYPIPEQDKHLYEEE
jgi:hypothetical protein